jgi:diguanylate cyclase (GGDEF)-like protein
MVIYADLDGFKEVNDRFGHAIGDEVLRQAAARLAAQFRSGDVVARLGGDEFAIVAPELDSRAADDLIQRVRAAFNNPMPGHPDDGVITVSLGATPLDRFGTDSPERAAEAALHQADMAMYADKRSHHH